MSLLDFVRTWSFTCVSYYGQAGISTSPSHDLCRSSCTFVLLYFLNPLQIWISSITIRVKAYFILFNPGIKKNNNDT